MKSFNQFREELQIDEMAGANMDTRAVHQRLKKSGWSLTGTTGGHDKFTHPASSMHIAVPRHRQLKAPLVKSILKTADSVSEKLQVAEDGMGAGAVSAGPTNTTGGGQVAGMGQPPGSRSGEPGVGRKKKAYSPVMMGIRRKNI
jgi:predicted RNA binding protein YcfA (HicA-like mRNA interferase family)